MNLQVLSQNINTADATGRLLFNMLGAISQFETEIRAERQMDGILKAKEKGKLIKTLMREYNLSRARMYRYLSTQSEDSR